jgi:4-hydroxy-2-oxoheptanedioate aldolase
MIENKEGVENSQEIAAVEGVDALMMGPMDLSFELGVPGQTSHQMVVTATLESANSAKNAYKHFVVGEAGGDLLQELRANGASIFTGNNDGAYLLSALTKAAQDFNQKLS